MKYNRFNSIYNAKVPSIRYSSSNINLYGILINYINKYDGEFSCLKTPESLANTELRYFKNFTEFYRKPLKPVYLDDKGGDFLDINYLNKVYSVTSNYSLVNKNTFYFYSNRAYSEDYRQGSDAITSNYCLQPPFKADALYYKYWYLRKAAPHTRYINSMLSHRSVNFNRYAKDLVSFIILN